MAEGVANRGDLGKPPFELAAAGSRARVSGYVHRRFADQLRHDISTRLEEWQALDDSRSTVSAGEGWRTISEANRRIRRSRCKQHCHVAYQHGLTSQVGQMRSAAAVCFQGG